MDKLFTYLKWSEPAFYADFPSARMTFENGFGILIKDTGNYGFNTYPFNKTNKTGVLLRNIDFITITKDEVEVLMQIIKKLKPTDDFSVLEKECKKGLNKMSAKQPENVDNWLTCPICLTKPYFWFILDAIGAKCGCVNTIPIGLRCIPTNYRIKKEELRKKWNTSQNKKVLEKEKIK